MANYGYARVVRVGRNDLPDHLQPGAIYELTFPFIPNADSFHTIINGNNAFCLLNGCAFLEGGDWEILENLDDLDEDGEPYEDE